METFPITSSCLQTPGWSVRNEWKAFNGSTKEGGTAAPRLYAGCLISLLSVASPAQPQHDPEQFQQQHRLQLQTPQQLQGLSRSRRCVCCKCTSIMSALLSRGAGRQTTAPTLIAFPPNPAAADAAREVPATTAAACVATPSDECIACQSYVPFQKRSAEAPASVPEAEMAFNLPASIAHLMALQLHRSSRRRINAPSPHRYPFCGQLRPGSGVAAAAVATGASEECISSYESCGAARRLRTSSAAAADDASLSSGAAAAPCSHTPAVGRIVAAVATAARSASYGTVAEAARNADAVVVAGPTSAADERGREGTSVLSTDITASPGRAAGTPRPAAVALAQRAGRDVATEEAASLALPAVALRQVAATVEATAASPATQDTPEDAALAKARDDSFSVRDLSIDVAASKAAGAEPASDEAAADVPVAEAAASIGRAVEGEPTAATGQTAQARARHNSASVTELLPAEPLLHISVAASSELATRYPQSKNLGGYTEIPPRRAAVSEDTEENDARERGPEAAPDPLARLACACVQDWEGGHACNRGYVRVCCCSFPYVAVPQVDAATIRKLFKLQRYPYQLAGVHWLTLLCGSVKKALPKGALGGAVLADEAGMGSTVQIVMLLSLGYQLGAFKSATLIVVPSSAPESNSLGGFALRSCGSVPSCCRCCCATSSVSSETIVASRLTAAAGRAAAVEQASTVSSSFPQWNVRRWVRLLRRWAGTLVVRRLLPYATAASTFYATERKESSDCFFPVDAAGVENKRQEACGCCANKASTPVYTEAAESASCATLAHVSSRAAMEMATAEAAAAGSGTAAGEIGRSVAAGVDSATAGKASGVSTTEVHSAAAAAARSATTVGAGSSAAARGGGSPRSAVSQRDCEQRASLSPDDNKATAAATGEKGLASPPHVLIATYEELLRYPRALNMLSCTMERPPLCILDARGLWSSSSISCSSSPSSPRYPGQIRSCGCCGSVRGPATATAQSCCCCCLAAAAAGGGAEAALLSCAAGPLHAVSRLIDSWWSSQAAGSPRAAATQQNRIGRAKGPGEKCSSCGLQKQEEEAEKKWATADVHAESTCCCNNGCGDCGSLGTSSSGIVGSRSSDRRTSTRSGGPRSCGSCCRRSSCLGGRCSGSSSSSSRRTAGVHNNDSGVTSSCSNGRDGNRCSGSEGESKPREAAEKASTTTTEGRRETPPGDETTRSNILLQDSIFKLIVTNTNPAASARCLRQLLPLLLPAAFPSAAAVDKQALALFSKKTREQQQKQHGRETLKQQRQHLCNAELPNQQQNEHHQQQRGHCPSQQREGRQQQNHQRSGKGLQHDEPQDHQQGHFTTQRNAVYNGQYQSEEHQEQQRHGYVTVCRTTRDMEMNHQDACANIHTQQQDKHRKDRIIQQQQTAAKLDWSQLQKEQENGAKEQIVSRNENGISRQHQRQQKLQQEGSVLPLHSPTRGATVTQQEERRSIRVGNHDVQQYPPLSKNTDAEEEKRNEHRRHENVASSVLLDTKHHQVHAEQQQRKRNIDRNSTFEEHFLLFARSFVFPLIMRRQRRGDLLPLLSPLQSKIVMLPLAEPEQQQQYAAIQRRATQQLRMALRQLREKLPVRHHQQQEQQSRHVQQRRHGETAQIHQQHQEDQRQRQKQQDLMQQHERQTNRGKQRLIHGEDGMNLQKPQKLEHEVEQLQQQEDPEKVSLTTTGDQPKEEKHQQEQREGSTGKQQQQQSQSLFGSAKTQPCRPPVVRKRFSCAAVQVREAFMSAREAVHALLLAAVHPLLNVASLPAGDSAVSSHAFCSSFSSLPSPLCSSSPESLFSSPSPAAVAAVVSHKERGTAEDAVSSEGTCSDTSVRLVGRGCSSVSLGQQRLDAVHSSCSALVKPVATALSELLAPRLVASCSATSSSFSPLITYPDGVNGSEAPSISCSFPFSSSSPFPPVSAVKVTEEAVEHTLRTRCTGWQILRLAAALGLRPPTLRQHEIAWGSKIKWLIDFLALEEARPREALMYGNCSRSPPCTRSAAAAAACISVAGWRGTAAGGVDGSGTASSRDGSERLASLTVAPTPAAAADEEEGTRTEDERKQRWDVAEVASAATHTRSFAPIPHTASSSGSNVVQRSSSKRRRRDVHCNGEELTFASKKMTGAQDIESERPQEDCSSVVPLSYIKRSQINVPCRRDQEKRLRRVLLLNPLCSLGRKVFPTCVQRCTERITTPSNERSRSSSTASCDCCSGVRGRACCYSSSAATSCFSSASCTCFFCDATAASGSECCSYSDGIGVSSGSYRTSSSTDTCGTSRISTTAAAEVICTCNSRQRVVNAATTRGCVPSSPDRRANACVHSAVGCAPAMYTETAALTPPVPLASPSSTSCFSSSPCSARCASCCSSSSASSSSFVRIPTAGERGSVASLLQAATGKHLFVIQRGSSREQAAQLLRDFSSEDSTLLPALLVEDFDVLLQLPPHAFRAITDVVWLSPPISSSLCAGNSGGASVTPGGESGIGKHKTQPSADKATAAEGQRREGPQDKEARLEEASLELHGDMQRLEEHFRCAGEQRETLRVYYLCCENTVDEACFRSTSAVQDLILAS